MNLDGRPMSFDFGDDDYVTYGRRPTPLWQTPVLFDGQSALNPRRPELLTDRDLDAWWQDLKTWSEWVVDTFRLDTVFPPCWPRHRPLVEELMALWLQWQAAWVPGIDPNGPIGFLHELEWSANRVKTLYRLACDPTEHREPSDPIVGADGDTELHRWWGNPNYPQEEPPPWQ